MKTKSSFTAEFRIKAILDEAEQELKKFSTSAKSIWQGQEPPKSLSKALEQLEAKLISLRQLSEKGRIDSSDVAQAESDYRMFQKTLRGVGIDFKLFTQEQKKAMLGKEEAENIEKRREAIEKYSRALAKNAELTKKRAPIESEITQKKATIRNKKAANTRKAKQRDSIETGKPVMPPDAEQYLRNLERQKQLQQELAGLERELIKRRNAGQVAKAGGNYARQLERQAELQRELASIDLTTGVTEYQDYTTAIATADAQIEKLNQEIKDNETAISTAGDEIEALEKKLKRLELVDENVALTELKTALAEAGVAGADTATSFDELKQKVNELDAQALAQVEERIKVATAGMEELGNSMKRTETELDKTTQSLQAQNEALNAQQAFANRISQFVGLEGAAQLARRALSNAMKTIKELDEAMTEMAVVTDLGVGDYWDQLPEYTTRANALGVSIKSAYESATLFYQQGLKTNEVMAISNETLKMARIAGLSAENATNKMTAALRGFNMELNETSAQKVADVYSKLAAITASDVKEISSAMTKTASIASSAGMEFETTAAFLSQIIETTRESAETAGTAMKTVIARFQELKKDPAEVGEVDGEIVDANKIETALRSVGVALRDSSGQFRELDEVFLELSSKWADLDTNTQRYIATIAAGSRQQSRFIAMMSDYSRTQELVSAANNSTGASAEQFAKTIDSLGSKLNRLQNAWDTFSMGLINHKLVKGGVDFLTKLITLLDKTSNSLGTFGGILSKIGLTLTVFKAGKVILDKFVISIQEKFREAGYKAGQAFKQGMEGEVFQSKDRTDSKDSSNEKTKLFFGKTRKNYKNAVSTLGQASQDLDASRRLNKEAKEESKIGKKQKSTGQEQIDSGVLKIGEEFRTKMSQITGDTEKAKDAWKKYEQELKKGSQEATKAIEDMNSELQQASSKRSKRSKRPKRSVQAKNRKASKGQKTQNQEKAQTDKIEKQDLTQLDKQNKGIKELTEGHKNLTEATEHNENATRKKTEAERLSQEANKKSQKGMTDLGKAMSTVSQTTIGIGVGITALSGLMERLGFEEESEKVADFGATVALFGSAMMALPPIIKFLGLTFSKAGVQIAVAGHTAQAGWLLVTVILTAVIALVVLIAKLFSSKNSPQGKLKEAEEAAQAAAEAANQAKEAFEDLQSSFDKYKEIKDTLGSLEEGTLEWRKAMLELNSEVMELLTLYPQLASYVRIGENGVLEIDDVGMEEMLNLAYQRAQTASVASAFATIQAKEQAKASAKEESEDAKTIKTHRRYGGVTDSGLDGEEARLTKLDNKLKDNTFDASFEFIEAEDYDKLTEEQLRRLYDSSHNKWGYSENQGTTPNEIIQYLKENHQNGITLYSKDVFDYASGSFVAMEKIAESATDLMKVVNDTNLEIQTAIKSAVVSSLSTTTGDYTQMLSKVYSDLFESNEIDFNQKIEEREKENKGKLWANDNSDTKTELEDKLIDLGFTPSGDEVKDMATYYKALTGEEYDYSNDGNKADDILAEKIARAEVAKEYTEEMEKTVEIADSNPILSDLLKGDLDVDLSAAADEISSLFPDSSTDESSTGIKKKFEGAIEVIEQEREDIDEKMEEIFGKGFFGEDGAKNISYKVADQIKETYDMIASYADESTAELFADAVKPILKDTTLSAEETAEKMNEFLNVQWNSAIEGAATLNKWLKSDNEQLKEFATNMLYAKKGLYSVTSQMNEFYKSMSSETLEKLAEDGKISATEILELAKSNEQLATMMDTTKVSAATLGKYYDLIKKKTLKAIEATDSFVVALDKLNSASNAIENSFAFIDTFEPSRSQTEISSYFSEMRETIMELYDKGAYGDKQLMDYIQAFLGEDNWSSLLSKNNNNLKTAIDQAISQINIYGDNLYQVWKSLAENEDFEGVTLGKDGIIEFDLDIIGTTDNLKKKIMDMGWSETMAEALVADAQTFSSNLEKELKSVDIESALESWLANAFKLDKKTIIPKSQVAAMAEELGLEFQQVKGILNKKGIDVIDFFTSDGGLSAKLREKFHKTMRDMGTGDEAIDFEAGYEMLLELGLDDTAAKKELKILAESLEDVDFSIGEESYQKTTDKFEQSGQEIAKNIINAQIDAMEDPKVKRAQQAQAKEQGKMLSKALIMAQSVATSSMIKITTKSVDAMINSMTKTLGLNITSNIAGHFEKEFPLNSIIEDALKATEGLWDDAGEVGGKNFNDTMLEYVNTTKEEVEDIANDLAKEVEDSKSGKSTAYTTDDSQTVKTDDSSETETWENPYDEIYNLNKKINAVIRERERLERNYERALNDSSKTAQELADITAGELKALKEEAILQKNTAEVARQYISYRQKDNARFSKYYTYDSETNVIQVDWEAVGKSGWDSDTSDEFKEFISYLEEQVDTIQEAEDKLEDIQDSVDDIENRGRDATSEIYDQVKEGLIKERQNQIDELQNINDSIQEAQSALVEQMQKQIDEARQARENDKTEEDIADKRTRLAYLQQDTSGAKALEIMALEKEIREAEEGYTDSLVDQALQKLQDANEKAAEQRQRQIELAQLALNEYEESGKVWTDVKKLVDEGFADVADGVPFVKTEAGKLALISQGINGLNPISKKDFYDELDRNAKEGAIHQGFVSVTGEGKEGKTIADLSNDVTTAIKTNMDFGKIEPPIVNVTVNTGDYDPDDPDDPEDPERNTNDAEYKILDRETYERDTSMSARLRRDYYGTYENYLQKVYDLISKGKTPEFKTGGLADFTGPAWLDGTKSRPELVLNQTDTANFIALKDILAEVFDNSNSLSKGNSKSGGDNYYDIEISVEKIGDDYDVDRLADRIKEIIYEDSVYRNVNAVNFMR